MTVLAADTDADPEAVDEREPEAEDDAAALAETAADAETLLLVDALDAPDADSEAVGERERVDSTTQGAVPMSSTLGKKPALYQLQRGPEGCGKGSVSRPHCDTLGRSSLPTLCPARVTHSLLVKQLGSAHISRPAWAAARR